jgi:RNA polymerase sigma factor (sigma-70 family)
LKPDGAQVAPLVETSGQERASSLAALGAMYAAFLEAWAGENLPNQLKRRVSASSVVQETLLRVHEHAEDFEGRSLPQFEQYLLRIAQNIIVDLHRFHLAQRRSIRREKSLEDLESAAFWDTMRSVASEAAGHRLEAQDEAQHRARRVQQALLRLPKHYQRVIRSRYELNWSTAQIAQKLGCTEGAARELVRRAVAKLRARLIETGNETTESR